MCNHIAVIALGYFGAFNSYLSRVPDVKESGSYLWIHNSSTQNDSSYTCKGARQSHQWPGD